MMLDVSRHFFGVETIRRLVDLLAIYKMNRLHLSDDQGWRIMVRSWPNLALYGGSTQVGGGPGGYYSQEEYAEVVAYARSRQITVVPEINMLGHTNAALASYPELTCDGIAPPFYTGTEMGFSSLRVHKEVTYRFVEDGVGYVEVRDAYDWDPANLLEGIAEDNTLGVEAPSGRRRFRARTIWIGWFSQSSWE